MRKPRRRRPGDRRLRPQGQNTFSCRALAGKTDPGGAPPAHQQRQRLPQPPQAMAQPFQRRRHQEPAKRSRLATRARSLGRPNHSTKLDQKRHRKWAIPTTNAIRAIFPLPPPHPLSPRRRFAGDELGPELTRGKDVSREKTIARPSTFRKKMSALIALAVGRVGQSLPLAPKRECRERGIVGDI